MGLPQDEAPTYQVDGGSAEGVLAAGGEEGEGATSGAAVGAGRVTIKC